MSPLVSLAVRNARHLARAPHLHAPPRALLIFRVVGALADLEAPPDERFSAKLRRLRRHRPREMVQQNLCPLCAP